MTQDTSDEALTSGTDNSADATGAASPVRDGARETIESLKAAAGAARDTASAAAGFARDAGSQWKEQAGAFAEQAVEGARTAATTVKDKTGTALHGLSQLIADTAATVEGRLGPQYGDMTRKAAESVAGAARSLDDKDLDQLLGEARDFVRKSPAITIGAAAVAGFVLMRLARGSGHDQDEKDTES